MTASPSSLPQPFVTTDWLADHLGQPDLVVVDGSWYLPTEKRDPAAEYLAAHIPGAVWFNIDEIADKSTGLPHMLPDEASFARAMQALGISDTMRIVVYDGSGLFSAPRVRWTLQVFGAKNVALLEGGLPQWKAEGRPLENGIVTRAPQVFKAKLQTQNVASLEDVKQALETGHAKVLDARPAARFRGDAPEPRPGLRAGHMPGSHNLPFASLIDNGRLKTPEALEAALTQAGVGRDEPVITTCGSGVSAAMLALALETTGRKLAGLYDGSWAEWGGHPDTKVVTGD